MNSCIYQLWLSDTHFYIGRAKDFDARVAKHKWMLLHGKHGNSYMQSVFNKTGYFHAERLVECDHGALPAWEQAFLDANFGTNGCLNISNSNMGGSPKGTKKRYTKRSPEGCKNMARRGPRGPQSQATIDKRVATRLRNRLEGQLIPPVVENGNVTSSTSGESGPASSATDVLIKSIINK